MIERHEIEAWLGDSHGLADDQITDLMRQAGEIHERYPDPDDAEDRDAALYAAYELMARDREEVLAEMAGRLTYARALEARALAGMRQATLTLVPPKIETEAGLARKLGVDRMAVRGWLGKR